jgi:hypothetical protein
MTDRFAELGLFFVTLLAWLLLVYVIMVLPVSSSTQTVFYGAGFVALAGTAALVSALYQTRARVDGLRHRAVGSLGAGMRFAFAVEFALWLQSLRVLTAAYLIFIAAGFLLIEILFRYASTERRGYRE